MVDDLCPLATPDPIEVVPENPIAGCLLVHGFTGSPAEMRPLADYLGTHGYHCLVPLLPGHGRTIEDLHRVRWQDWVQAAEAGLVRLEAAYESVYAVGFSLGTLIVAHLCAVHPELAAVALLSPALEVRNRFVPLTVVCHRLVRTLPKGPSTLQAADARDHIWSYDRWSTHGAAEMWRLQRQVKRELGSIRVPAFAIQSTQDTVVASDSARRMIAGWGGSDRELLMLQHSDHAVLLDVEREIVNTRVGEFFARHSARMRAVSPSQ
jgi:carboxylesterase